MDLSPTSGDSVCLPSWKHYPHFPLGDGEQLTPPPTSVSSCNSSQSNKHIPSQWPQWLVQGHDAKHENQSQGSERAVNKKALSFPLSGQSSHICLRLLTQPAQSLPDNKDNQEENGGHRWSLTVKEKRGWEEVWVLVTCSLWRGYKLRERQSIFYFPEINVISVLISHCTWWQNSEYETVCQSVCQSTHGLFSWVWVKGPQHKVWEDSISCLLAGALWEIHDSTGSLLTLYSDLSLSCLSPPCGPSGLCSCLLTTPKYSRKTVYFWPDPPNNLYLHTVVSACLLGFRWT